MGTTNDNQHAESERPSDRCFYPMKPAKWNPLDSDSGEQWSEPCYGRRDDHDPASEYDPRPDHPFTPAPQPHQPAGAVEQCTVCYRAGDGTQAQLSCRKPRGHMSPHGQAEPSEQGVETCCLTSTQ